MLADQLKITQADAFVLYLKAHFYHWNIEGPNFPQYHDFLQNFYQDVFASVDSIAELIRTLDVYAPGTLSRLQSLTNIEESEVIPDDMTMVKNILAQNNVMLETLKKGYDMAEEEKQFGISNFLQDRIQAHEKHGWMLRSITK
jgi:starvation-inducible DNA-binding protein